MQKFMGSKLPKTKLSEIITVFSKIGTTAFGGPAAHIAMMEEEVVRRKQWLSKEEFLDLLGATNLIPGPNSTEMAIHIGFKMGGWPGLIAAGVSFICPAFLIVLALAWSYVKFGSLPLFQSIFLGVKPVIVAVIAQAVWSLSKSAIKDRILAALAILALGAYLLWNNEIVILFLIALLNLVIRRNSQPTKKTIAAVIFAVCVNPLVKVWAQSSEFYKTGIENIFWYFIKIGSVLFGSGYVLIAFLQDDLVSKYQWITQQQLLDAVAVGQFTPGPVFTTATFIGYLIYGKIGAVVATIGIFLPAFVFVALSAPFLPKLRRSKPVALLLDGLNVASLSLMAASVLLLAQSSVNSIYGVLIFLISLVLLIRFKINSSWLILSAALLSFIN